uniref:Phosphoinositide-interacting protein n=1 Tax=Scophthalmus maximus TaxID=52904 RepID=A0A8D3A5S9_SCOMX
MQSLVDRTDDRAPSADCREVALFTAESHGDRLIGRGSRQKRRRKSEELWTLSTRSGSAGAPGWAYLHKPIIVMVMGSLMCAAGGVLFLLQSSGVTEAYRSVASACGSIGLMFVVMGLVWIPILKEKRRRKRCNKIHIFLSSR